MLGMVQIKIKGEEKPLKMSPNHSVRFVSGFGHVAFDCWNYYNRTSTLSNRDVK